MANDPSKTEKATHKRIDDTRNKGNVLQSQDVVSFLLLLFSAVVFYLFVPTIAEAFQDGLHRITQIDSRVEWDEDQIIIGAEFYIKTIAKLVLPIMFVVTFVAGVSMRLQVGKYFSLKPLMWKFDSFNPKKGVQSLLPKKDNFIKLAITLGKVSVISFVVYLSISEDFNEIMTLSKKSLRYSAPWMGKRAFIMVMKVLALIMVLAVIDYIHKYKQYYDGIKMSKQEIKDERKNSEGDPQIKAKIRQKMMQIMRSSMMSDVANSDVVVTNPTHVAVALNYEPGDLAPKVVAKGLRKQADNIKHIAREHGVPVVEAAPLARSLYRNVEVGHYIAPEYFSGVAAILAKLKSADDKLKKIKKNKEK